MLEEKLNEDLKCSLRDKNSVKLSVIRMLKTDINNTAIRLKKNALSDDEILNVIGKHIKQHMDSIEQFKKGGRQDLVDTEERELEILNQYRPEQMSDEELEKLVKAAIGKTGAAAKKDLGKVIKAVMDEAKGRSDGKRVSMAAQRLLG